MKLKDCKNWKSVRLDDRTILSGDLALMSLDQRRSLEDLEVIEAGTKGAYKITSLATNLNRIRIERNISQAKLAERSGVNLRMIQYYEQGVKDINKASALTVYQIATALGVTVEDLLEK